MGGLDGYCRQCTNSPIPTRCLCRHGFSAAVTHGVSSTRTTVSLLLDENDAPVSFSTNEPKILTSPAEPLSVAPSQRKDALYIPYGPRSIEDGNTIGPHATGVSLPRFSVVSVNDPPCVPPVAETVTQTRVERFGIQTPGLSWYVSSKMTAASLNDTEKDGSSGGGGGAGGSGSSNPHRHSPPDTGKDDCSKSYVPFASQEPEHPQFAEQQNETSRSAYETQSHPLPSSLRMGFATVFASQAIAVAATRPRRSARHTWHTMPWNASANV